MGCDCIIPDHCLSVNFSQMLKCQQLVVFYQDLTNQNLLLIFMSRNEFMLS